MAEVIVCVVETGIPKTEANCSTPAAEGSVAKPCSVPKGAIFIAKVLIMRHQPKATPTTAVTPTLKITQRGTVGSFQPD
jgi:hypothetical protein